MATRALENADYEFRDAYAQLVASQELPAQQAMFKAIFIAFKDTANVVSWYPYATQDWQRKLSCIYVQCHDALGYAFQPSKDGKWLRKSDLSESYMLIDNDVAYWQQPPWLTLIAQTLRSPDAGGNAGMHDFRSSMAKKSKIDIGAHASEVYRDLTLLDHARIPRAGADTRLKKFVRMLYEHCTPKKPPLLQPGHEVQLKLRTLLRCATFRFNDALMHVMERTPARFPDMTLRVHVSKSQSVDLPYETLENRMMAHEDPRVDYMAIVAALKNCWGDTLHWDQCGSERARKGLPVTQQQVETSLASMVALVEAAENRVGLPEEESLWLHKQLRTLGWTPAPENTSNLDQWWAEAESFHG